MHTYMPNDRIRFHHNGGFDGDIIICDKEKDVEIRVDSEELLDFVVSRYVNQRLEELSQHIDPKTMILLVPFLRMLDKKGES